MLYDIEKQIWKRISREIESNVAEQIGWPVFNLIGARSLADGTPFLVPAEYIFPTGSQIWNRVFVQAKEEIDDIE
jgi:hypothetical protein